MLQSNVSRRHAMILAAAGVLAGGLAGAAGGVELRLVPATRLLAPGDVAYVPPSNLQTIADIYKRMTAPVKVNGAGPFPFVVDTGANQSVISESLVLQLGLARGEEAPLNGVAGVWVSGTTTATLGIGSRTQVDVVMSILPGEAMGGAGLLGLDRLDGQKLTLDFHKQSLQIESGRHARRDPEAIAVKARRRGGQLTLIDVNLAGVPLTAFLDSGAQATIGNMALRDMALVRNPTSFWSKVPILSATGQTIEADIANLPALRVGGLHLPNWPVAFADLHTFRIWDLVKRPAILLGVDVMSRFERVSLDFARNEVSFRLPQGS
jgi:predicted aspartyl protease